MRHLRIVFTAWLLSLFGLTARAQIESGTWRTLAPMPLARQEVAAAVLSGKIYVIAGYDAQGRSTNTVQVYNPRRNSWALASPIPVLNNHPGAAVAAGKLYTFGGLSNRCFVFNSAGGWSDVAPMLVQHGNTPAVGVIAEKIYVAGGTQGGASLPQLEMYNPATNTWTLLAPMSVARNHCAGAVIGGKFYVVGGRGSGAAPTALEVYNPQTNSWSSLAPMPTPRSGIAAAAVNGELWVFGGEIPTIHDEVEVYNPATNSWHELPPMPLPRHGFWAAVIGDHIHLPGGGVEQGFGATNANHVFIVNRKATFANISARANVQTGNRVLIVGFIVSGTGAKRIIVRGLGPSLPISGALANPTLELRNSSGQLIAANDNWGQASNAQEINESALGPRRATEAAILRRVGPGSYTAIVRGVNNSTGTALLEVYDLEAGSDAKLRNISARADVQTGNNVLIDGLIVSGKYPLRVIVRGLGPSLPLAGSLPNPTLALHNANGQVFATNDNWRTSQQAEIAATGLAPRNALESAILRMFTPGNYTAVLRGVGNSTGIGLLDAHDIP